MSSPPLTTDLPFQLLLAFASCEPPLSLAVLGSDDPSLPGGHALAPFALLCLDVVVAVAVSLFLPRLWHPRLVWLWPRHLSSSSYSLSSSTRVRRGVGTRVQGATFFFAGIAKSDANPCWRRNSVSRSIILTVTYSTVSDVHTRDPRTSYVAPLRNADDVVFIFDPSYICVSATQTRDEKNKEKGMLQGAIHVRLTRYRIAAFRLYTYVCLNRNVIPLPWPSVTCHVSPNTTTSRRRRHTSQSPHYPPHN